MSENENQKDADVSTLIKQDLAGFQVIQMTEVYRIDTDGRKTGSLGFFKDLKIATAFIGVQKDSDYYRTSEEFVLTNGVVGFVVTNGKSVKLFDDAQEAIKLREAVLSKLSPAERTVLGF